MSAEAYVFKNKNLFLMKVNFSFRMAYDPNDAELQDALKYLALPTEEKLKLRSQAFDAKKACWVPDAKEVFIAGEIVSTKGETSVVKTARGEVTINYQIYRSYYSIFCCCLGCDSQNRTYSTNESTKIYVLR